MAWYAESTAAHGTHRGTLARGSVHTACGLRLAAQKVAQHPAPPAESNRICPQCRADS